MNADVESSVGVNLHLRHIAGGVALKREGTAIAVGDSGISCARVVKEIGRGARSVVCDGCIGGSGGVAEIGHASTSTKTSTRIAVDDCRMIRGRAIEEVGGGAR